MQEGTAARSWTALGAVGAGAAMGEMHRYTDDEKAHFLRRMWAEGLTPASAARLWGNHPDGATVAGWLRQLAEGRLEVGSVRVPHSCEGRHEKHKRYPADTRREALRLMGLGVGSREVARALGLPGDPRAGDPERLSNRRKAELGERLRRDARRLHGVVRPRQAEGFPRGRARSLRGAVGGGLRASLTGTRILPQSRKGCDSKYGTIMVSHEMRAWRHPAFDEFYGGAAVD